MKNIVVEIKSNSSSYLFNSCFFKKGKVIFSETSLFGTEYKIETILKTPLKGEIRIYSGWIIKNEKADELLLSSPFVEWIK